MERDLTTGNVFKTVVYFSLPYLLSYFLQTLYGMADLFIVGQFGHVSSTTAVSIGSQIMHMLTVMLVGLAMGATVMIGRCIGAKDCKKMKLRYPVLIVVLRPGRRCALVMCRYIKHDTAKYQKCYYYCIIPC